MKLECLRLAVDCASDDVDVTKLAQKFYDFCRSRADGGLKVELPTGKARVVGKDGDIEGPFKDYLKE